MLIFSCQLDSLAESWLNLSQSDSVLCDGLISWLFESTYSITESWLNLSQSDSVFLGQTDSFFSKNESKWLDLYGSKLGQHDSIFESLWLGKNSQCRYVFTNSFQWEHLQQDVSYLITGESGMGNVEIHWFICQWISSAVTVSWNLFLMGLLSLHSFASGRQEHSQFSGLSVMGIIVRWGRCIQSKLFIWLYLVSSLYW